MLVAFLLAPDAHFTNVAQGDHVYHPNNTPDSAAQLRLWASPETPWVRPGERVTFAILAEGDVRVSGAEVTLDYGPDVELVEVKAGPYLGKETIAAPPRAEEAQATYAWARIGEAPLQELPGELALVTVTATKGRPWNSWVRARVRLVDDSFQKFQETTLFVDLHVYNRLPSPIPVWPSDPSRISGAPTGPQPVFRARTLSRGTFKYKIEVSQDDFQSVLHASDQTISTQGWDKQQYQGWDVAKFSPLETLEPGEYQWRAYVWVQEVGRWSPPSRVEKFEVQPRPMGLTRADPTVVRSFDAGGTPVMLEGWGLTPDTRVSLTTPGSNAVADTRWVGDSRTRFTLWPDTSPGVVVARVSRPYGPQFTAPVLVLPPGLFQIRTVLPWGDQIIPGEEFPVRFLATNLGTDPTSVALVSVGLPDLDSFELVEVRAGRGGQVLQQDREEVLLSVTGDSVVDFTFRVRPGPAVMPGAEGEHSESPASFVDFDFSPLVLGDVPGARWRELGHLPLSQRVQAAQRETEEELGRIAQSFNQADLDTLENGLQTSLVSSDASHLVQELLQQLQRHGLDTGRLSGIMADESARQSDCCQVGPGRLQVVSARDPDNLRAYPKGLGFHSYVAGDHAISYLIRFENPADAPRPATDVTVIAQLAPVIDLEDVRVDGSSHEDAMSVALDSSNNTITWSFQDIGLPPNTGPPQGEGWVEFSISSPDSVPSGAVVGVAAAVRVDSGPPVETNEVMHTVDAAAASTQVGPLSTVQLSPSFQVPWEGDDNGGSGIQKVVLMASKNGGPFEVVGTTAESSFAFQGELGATYSFVTVGVDRVGNVEEMPEEPDATVTLGQRLLYEKGLHLVGIPVATQRDSEGTLAAPGSIWSVWDTSQQTYSSQNGASGLTTPVTSQPGRGLWARFEEGATLMIAGQPVPADQPYAIDLVAGWNLIASPFTAPVPWSLDNIRIRAEGAEKTLREAQLLGWMEDFAWGWNGDAYALVYDSSVVPGVASDLEPFQGYWVQAHRDLTLLLPPPP